MMEKKYFAEWVILSVLLCVFVFYAALYGANLLRGEGESDALPGTDFLKKLYAAFLCVPADDAAVLPPLSSAGGKDMSAAEKKEDAVSAGSEAADPAPEALEAAVSGNLLFWNNAAHAVFSDEYFDADAYGRSMAAFTDAASAHTSDARLIGAVSPISSFAAEEALAEAPNTVPAVIAGLMGESSQKDALVRLEKAAGDHAVIPDFYGVFAEHREEYLFFRTDHHWTSAGAYLAAAEILAALDREILPMDALDRAVTDEAFLGSFYRSTFSRQLEKSADTVTVLMPAGDAAVTCYNAGGGILYSGGTVLEGESGVDSFAGDAPLSVFETEEDGVLLLIGDSFKNQLAPILSAHFGTVVSVDYRTYDSDGGLPAFSDLLERLDPDAIVIVQNIINAGDAVMSEQLLALAESAS